MKTFDYITAWHDAAKPAYESLPQNLRDLLDRTARVAADLHQLSDCSMPWPDVNNDPIASDVSGVDGFREAFRKVPAEWLAFAARAIHSIGHWYPSTADGYEIPGRNNRGTWKFAHYADQDLRERLGLPVRGMNGREHGFGYAVHEGAIRIWYADPHTWQWIEVAPATATGLEHAKAVCRRIQSHAAGIDKRKKNEIRNAYYQGFEAAEDNLDGWPEDWRPFVDHRFMVEDDEMKAREAQRPARLQKTRAGILKDTAQKIADLEREREGMIWFLDHGISVENCIYYAHTNVFTFGWREKVSPAVESQILDVISEFPYAYAIKCADGRVLEGQ